MTSTEPFVFEGQLRGKRVAPAVERNRDAIADVLRDVLPQTGLVLEVASGTGEHAVHFARGFPALDWQPTDPDPQALASIAAWADDAQLPNLRPPQRLDAANPHWPVAAADALLCINMVHISPWAATLGLFDGASAILAPGAPLILYGPYWLAGEKAAASNVAFDQSLKTRNPDWGVRPLDDVIAGAQAAGFSHVQTIAMPANNLTIVFRRI